MQPDRARPAGEVPGRHPPLAGPDQPDPRTTHRRRGRGPARRLSDQRRLRGARSGRGQPDRRQLAEVGLTAESTEGRRPPDQLAYSARRKSVSAHRCAARHPVIVPGKSRLSWTAHSCSCWPGRTDGTYTGDTRPRAGAVVHAEQGRPQRICVEPCPRDLIRQRRHRPGGLVGAHPPSLPDRRTPRGTRRPHPGANAARRSE